MYQQISKTKGVKHMKKILTILAATATMFAFGLGNLDTTISQGADFEAFTAGNAFSAGLNDSAQQSSPFYWYTADTDAANIISNYTGSGTGVPIASRPEKFAGDVNSKYLQVETTGKLYRTVKDNGGSADFTTNVTATYAHSLADAPIYLDTLVKFTAADSVFGDDALENGDKIAIEYVEHESEGPGDDTVTNFVVRAGFVTGTGNSATVVQTNYFVTPPSNFDKDAWHRLTVRTISDVGDGTIGFVIYLDQALLKYSADVAAGDAAFVGGLNNDVSSKFYNDEDAAVGHALFPSVVRSGAAKTTISAAAFSGNGSLDDVVFTTTKPEFIQESAIVTVRWDTNKVTGVTLNTTTSKVLTPAEWSVGQIGIEPVNGSVGFSVSLAEGCVLGTCTVTPATSGGWDGANSFTNLKSGAVCDIVAIRPVCKVNDTYYEDLSEAITAAQAGTEQSPATLKLLADCDVALGFSTGYVILDLAGHDLQAVSDEATFTIANTGANLVITNSGEEASVKMPIGAASSGLIYLTELAGFTTIQAGTFEGYIYCDTSTSAKEPQQFLSIMGGKFLDPLYDESDPQPFYLASCVAAGLTPEHVQIGDAHYFQVGGGSVAPTTYTLTVTVADHTSATYKIGEGEATAYSEAVQVEAGSAVVITAIPASGYTYSGVDLGDGWTLDNGNAVYTIASMAAAATVVVPNPEEEPIGTYNVTVIPTNNTTYAAAYTVGGETITPVNDVLTVTVGQTITITVTPGANYEYATTPTGWTAGQDGKITIDVSAAGTV